MKGYTNEKNFINEINNKKYKEINILLQEFIKAIFPSIKNNDIIQAQKYGYYAKTDIIIEVNNIKKGISIKSGSKNSVHIEPINKFVKFLNNLEYKEIDKFLAYIYSDGTINNTGKNRISTEEYIKYHLNDLLIINKELEKIKEKIIIRSLIKTDVNYKVTVDAFILGEPNDFLWATKEEVIDYLQNISNESKNAHISNLYIQNWNKNIIQNPKYEHCRNYIQIKWYSMFDDFIKIMQNRIHKV